MANEKKRWDIRQPPSGPIKWPPDSPSPSTVEGTAQTNTPSHLTLREIEGWLKKLKDDIDALRARKAGSTHRHTRKLTFGWYLDGSVTVGDEQVSRPRLDRDVTVLVPQMNVKTAPAGSDLIVDMDYSADLTTWTPLWSTRPRILDGDEAGGTNAVASIATLVEGTWLRLNIDQVGSTTPGTDLTVQFCGESEQ